MEEIKPGKYIVAVSGGVDSVVLLAMLTQQKDLDLIVAHFDHGIREDSTNDHEFVAILSQKYQLPFEFAEGKLGKAASEDQARKARYEFLRQTRKKHRAKAIITAHHQDDVLETLILNTIRGTKRTGLSSLSSSEELLRPLLNHSKQELLEYAQKNHLLWHEDSTNSDDKYTRNWVRHNIVARMDAAQRARLLNIHKQTKELNEQIDASLQQIGDLSNSELSRQQFIQLPHEVAKEAMAVWLRLHNIRDFDVKNIERLTVGAKTALPGKVLNVKNGWSMSVSKTTLTLQEETRSRNSGPVSV